MNEDDVLSDDHYTSHKKKSITPGFNVEDLMERAIVSLLGKLRLCSLGVRVESGR